MVCLCVHHTGSVGYGYNHGGQPARYHDLGVAKLCGAQGLIDRRSCNAAHGVWGCGGVGCMSRYSRHELLDEHLAADGIHVSHL